MTVGDPWLAWQGHAPNESAVMIIKRDACNDATDLAVPAMLFQVHRHRGAQVVRSAGRRSSSRGDAGRRAGMDPYCEKGPSREFVWAAEQLVEGVADMETCWRRAYGGVVGALDPSTQGWPRGQDVAREKRTEAPWVGAHAV